MRLRAAIQNQVARRLLSVERRNANRQKAERQRQQKNAPHRVEYFHEAGDPYSHLMVQLLPNIAERYDCELTVHVVPPPADSAAPDRKRLEAWSRRDAALLAFRLGATFNDTGHQPSADRLEAANAALVDAVNRNAFLSDAPKISEALWSGATLPETKLDDRALTKTLSSAHERRRKLGHYLGGTLYYAGEWYWGPDRLHYLERRLQELGALKSDASPALIFDPPEVPSGARQAISETADRPELHWFLSFRSPYTGIVARRVKALADAYNADLKLRFVLPMVMRGMQVPREKGLYIMADVVREAERMGVPFGNVVDPVGTPVERGYAILPEAIARGRGFEFVDSFLSGVWADGLDAGTDRGLKQITERAGLDWAEMKPLIGGDHWRDEAEANQQEMFDYGLWGVPSFRVGEVAVWGQDRLWAVEEALAAASK